MIRWSDLPWRAKLTLLLGLLAALPLVVVTVVNVTAARTELIAASREQNLQRARSTAAAVDSYLEGVLSDLEIVARAPGTVRFLEGSGDPGVRRDLLTTLRQMTATQGFQALFLADPAGRIVLATDETMTGRSVIATRSFLEGISGNSLVHEPRYEPEDGRVYLRASAPVRSAGGPIAGVAVGLVPLAGLDRILAGDTGFAGRSEFGILWDSRGIRLSHPTRPGLRFRPFEPLAADAADRLVVERRFGPDTRRLLQVSQASLPPYGGLVERSRWLLYDRSLDPHLRIDTPNGILYAAAVPLRSQRWLYGVFSPQGAILAAVGRQIQRTLLVVALTGIAAIAAGLLAAQWATRPLRLVGQTANAIAAGDMSRRVGLRQADEVGQMAAAFDAMADALAAKEAELRGYADRLEQRVAEQTSELWAAVESEQEARLRAEEANRLKDEFLSTVSHELRTPLNAILGWTWLLVDGKLDAAGARRAVQTIERSARAQSQIIDDLLDVSSIVTGKLRLKVRAVDLAPLIESAVDAVRPAAQAKGILLDTRLERVSSLKGDPDRLQQVIWNLLSNAVKFTPPAGRIEVLADEADGQARIRVTDTGIGIPEAFLRYVFDRFRQADSSTTRKHGGLGLGLSIVRHLVELHGGTVSAESEGEGRGATFTVMLPLARPEASAAGAGTTDNRKGEPP